MKFRLLNCALLLILFGGQDVEVLAMSGSDDQRALEDCCSKLTLKPATITNENSKVTVKLDKSGTSGAWNFKAQCRAASCAVPEIARVVIANHNTLAEIQAKLEKKDSESEIQRDSGDQLKVLEERIQSLTEELEKERKGREALEEKFETQVESLTSELEAERAARESLMQSFEERLTELEKKRDPENAYHPVSAVSINSVPTPGPSLLDSFSDRSFSLEFSSDISALDTSISVLDCNEKISSRLKEIVRTVNKQTVYINTIRNAVINFGKSLQKVKKSIKGSGKK